MRKRIITSIVLLLIFNLSYITTFAESGDMTVTVADITANAGETVEIPVVLSGNTGFSNLAIEIGYNGNVMTLTNVTNSVSGASFTKAKTYTPNPFNMQWDNPDDVFYNGTLATLTFAVKDDAPNGVYPVTVDFYKGRSDRIRDNIDGYDINYNANEEALGVIYKNGSISIGDVKPCIEIAAADIDNLSFDVTLSAKEYTGDVWCALYTSAGRLISVKQKPAAKNLNFSFINGSTADYVKIMWWESLTISPLCTPQTIPLH